jgi:hypothetical protein
MSDVKQGGFNHKGTVGCLLFVVVGVALNFVLSGISELRRATLSPAERAREDSIRAAADSLQARKDRVWKMNMMGEAAVKARLKDPESARFGEQWVGGKDGTVFCGKVNAKNGFGGYTGEELYFGAGNLAVLGSDLKDMSPKEAKALLEMGKLCETVYQP